MLERTSEGPQLCEAAVVVRIVIACAEELVAHSLEALLNFHAQALDLVLFSLLIARPPPKEGPQLLGVLRDGAIAQRLTDEQQIERAPLGEPWLLGERLRHGRQQHGLTRWAELLNGELLQCRLGEHDAAAGVRASEAGAEGPGKAAQDQHTRRGEVLQVDPVDGLAERVDLPAVFREALRHGRRYLLLPLPQLQQHLGLGLTRERSDVKNLPQ
mmetsp:Transcript_80911/g.232471  ORF Transcript_80911/g.232471 Transcript_80911/m.232471 type:complete len:214 (-) Transcript_80911:396-1037(-)